MNFSHFCLAAIWRYIWMWWEIQEIDVFEEQQGEQESCEQCLLGSIFGKEACVLILLVLTARRMESRGGWCTKMHAKWKIPASIFSSEAWIWKWSERRANTGLILAAETNPTWRQSGGCDPRRLGNLHLHQHFWQAAEQSSSKQIRGGF